MTLIDEVKSSIARSNLVLLIVHGMVKLPESLHFIV